MDNVGPAALASVAKLYHRGVVVAAVEQRFMSLQAEPLGVVPYGRVPCDFFWHRFERGFGDD
jgi:hypothetical protein